jgi:hypothetical protein
MGRFRIAGLCLVATLALGASALGSGAQAAEYKWCRAVKKTGEFTESGCKTIAEKKGKPDHKGGWELKPVEACVAQKKGEYTNETCTVKSAKPKRGHFELTTGRTFTDAPGQAEFATPGLPASFSLSCSGSTIAGFISGTTNPAKTAVEQVTFTGCALFGIVPCESAGLNSTPSGTSGVIITNLLDSRLMGYPETVTWTNAFTNLPETTGPAVGEVWTELSSGEHEPYWFEAECGGTVLAVSNVVAGPITPVNTPTNTTTQTFALPPQNPSASAQGLETVEPGGPIEPSVLTTTETFNYATTIVIVP